MTISVFVFDDLPKNIDNAGNAKSQLCGDLSYANGFIVNTEKKWLDACREIQSIAGDCVLLCDLGFRDRQSSIWNSVGNAMGELGEALQGSFDPSDGLSFSHNDEMRTLPSEFIDGIALLNAIRGASAPGKTLIHLATTRGQPGVLKDLCTWLTNGFAALDLPRQVIVTVSADDLAGTASASRVMRELGEKWKEAYPPEYHKDSCINEWLLKYSRQLDNGGWTHGQCQKKDVQNAASALVGVELSDADVKAIFMHCAQTAPSEHYVRKASLIAASKGLGIELECSGDCDLVMFPGQPAPTNELIPPGFSFLVALKCLVEDMRSEDMLDRVVMRKDVAPVLKTSNRPKVVSYALTLHLKVPNERYSKNPGYAVAPKFVSRIGTGDDIADEPKTSQLLYRACHCRTVLSGSATSNMQTIFQDGFNQWVAWPSFGEDYIELRWGKRGV